MASEYRKLDQEHITYMQKSLLEGQLESLMSMKNLHAYRQLRQEELMQKIKLKKLIEETKQDIDVLLKVLPEPVQVEGEKDALTDEQEKKNSSLEAELDMIKAKLAALK